MNSEAEAVGEEEKSEAGVATSDFVSYHCNLFYVNALMRSGREWL